MATDSFNKQRSWVPTPLKIALHAFPRTCRRSKPEIFSKKDWDRGVEDGLKAVLFALWKEKQAQEFYEGIALRLKDKAAVSFFQELAKFEKRHADLLAEYVDESYYVHELIMG